MILHRQEFQKPACVFMNVIRGGAPVNMLTAAAKAGLRTAFIGKVGNDMHGKFLIEAVEIKILTAMALYWMIMYLLHLHL